MLTSVLIGTLSFCVVGIAETLIFNNSNETKTNERTEYINIRKSTLVTKDKYDVEEL